MIFSEIYGLYFRTVEKLIEKAVERKLDEKTFYDVISSSAFSESMLFVGDAIKNGEWLVVDDDGGTPYEFMPKTPLTMLEKRWLKTITQDIRFSLFVQNEIEWLKDIKPIFNLSDIVYPDRFFGGDDFEDAKYREHFKTILHALRENKMLSIEYTSGKGKRQSGEFLPRKIEYSSKEDKFRLYTGDIFKNNIININRITKCSLGDGFNKNALLPLKLKTDEVEFEITNERNCLERALIHFSSYEKETVQIDCKHFLVKIKYSTDDESEILIRLLQFGQFVKVVSPDCMVNKIKERVFMQKSCN